MWSRMGRMWGGWTQHSRGRGATWRSCRPRLEVFEDRTVLNAGALDPTFGVGGLVRTDFLAGTDEALGIFAQADGKLVVVGYAALGVEEEGGGPGGGGPGGGGDTGPNPLADFAVARYNADGSLDLTFNGTGKVVVDVANLASGGAVADDEDKALGVAVQEDGKIVVAGYVSRGAQTLPDGTVITNHDFAILRFNPDGSLDTTFDTNGIVVTDFGLSDDAHDIAIQPDGKIVVSGRTGTVGEGETSTADFALARYNADGSLDTSFGTGGLVTTDLASGSKDEGKRMDLMSDGRIVVAGMTESEATAGGPDFAAVRYNADGSLDTSFSDDGIVTTDFGASVDEGQDVVIQSDGKAILVGHVGGPSDFGLVRYNEDGSLDSSFGTGGKVITDLTGSSDFPFAVTLQPDGKVVAAGRGASGASFTYAVARYNPDGALDTSFGDGGKVLTDFGTPVPDQGYAVTMQQTPEGRQRIVVAGVAVSDFGLAAYMPSDIPPSLGGVLYIDHNANGARDVNEPPAVNWTVYLDANGNGALDVGERMAVTDGLGSYIFDAVAEGTHTVRIRLMPGDVAISHPGGQTATAIVGVVTTLEPMGLRHQLTAVPVTPVDTLFHPESPGDAAEHLVRSWYRAVLGREAEAGGLASWAGLLRATGAADQVFAGIWGSFEHRARVVDAYYREYLGRPMGADAMGWVNAMLGGASEVDVVAGILASAEYAARKGDNAGFVRSLYEELLGRTASDAEVAGHVAALNAGASRDGLVRAFVFSAEGSSHAVEALYSTSLERTVDAAGLSGWANAMTAGALSLEDVAASLLLSAEFQTKATVG